MYTLKVSKPTFLLKTTLRTVGLIFQCFWEIENRKHLKMITESNEKNDEEGDDDTLEGVDEIKSDSSDEDAV